MLTFKPTNDGTFLKLSEDTYLVSKPTFEVTLEDEQGNVIKKTCLVLSVRTGDITGAFSKNLELLCRPNCYKFIYTISKNFQPPEFTDGPIIVRICYVSREME